MMSLVEHFGMGDETEPAEGVEDAFKEMAETDAVMVDEPVGDEADVEVGGIDADESATEETSADKSLERALADAEEVVDFHVDDVESESKQVVTGGDFGCELALDRQSLAWFLRDLATQIESGRNLSIAGYDWEIPFEFVEPIEVEIEHEGAANEESRELEIEIEFAWDGEYDTSTER